MFFWVNLGFPGTTCRLLVFKPIVMEDFPWFSLTPIQDRGMGDRGLRRDRLKRPTTNKRCELQKKEDSLRAKKTNIFRRFGFRILSSCWSKNGDINRTKLCNFAEISWVRATAFKRYFWWFRQISKLTWCSNSSSAWGSSTCSEITSSYR